MKIESARLGMESNRSETALRRVEERLQRGFGGGETPPLSAGPPVQRVELSAAGRALAAGENPDLGAAPATDAARVGASDGSPAVTLLRGLLERVFGIHTEVFDASQLRVESSQSLQVFAENATTLRTGRGSGIAYDYHEARTAIEATRFSAEGVVRTSDGQEISFSLAFEMVRVEHQQIDISLRAGDAARVKDPLVINFNGPAAALSDQRFELDLDGDGERESAHFAGRGSGFLVFDRNGDGVVNDGGELFGPQSGDGFAELAGFDDDGNGWIDENDALFARLRVWTRDAAGESLRGLGDAQVGAIALGRVATPFSYRGDGGDLLGQLRQSGVYLSEDGRAGTIQQVDLAV